jgi:hypothetical protein
VIGANVDVVLAAVLAAALAAAPASIDAVARVDSDVVTVADVRERQRALARVGRTATPRDALAGLLEERLLAGEARRLGLDRTAEVQEQLAAVRVPLLVEALEADLGARFDPPEDALRALYHSSGDAIRLVLSKYATEAEARAALDRVAGGVDLRDEAKRSIDPALSRSRGDTGSLSRGQLDGALADVAFRAPLGETFGPVQLQLGWAIGRVTERTVSDDAGFADRRDALAAFARKQLATEARQHLAQQLRSKEGVKVDEVFLRSLGSRTDATAAELDHVVAVVDGSPLRYRAIHPSVAVLAGSNGHLAGPGTKVALAERAVEERLLAGAAVRRGLDRSPAVAGVLPGVEWNVLAAAYVARVARDPGAGTGDPKVRATLAELRSRARIQIDDVRLGAVSVQPPTTPR